MQKCTKGGFKLGDLKYCDFEHVAALCEQFIHIQAPTYIESSQSQYLKASQDIVRLGSETKQLFQNINVPMEYLRLHESQIMANSTEPATFEDLSAILERVFTLRNILQEVRFNWAEIQLSTTVLNSAKQKGESKNPTIIEGLSKSEELTASIQKEYIAHYQVEHDYLFSLLMRLMSSNLTAKTELLAKAKALWTVYNRALIRLRYPNHNHKDGLPLNCPNFITSTKSSFLDNQNFQNELDARLFIELMKQVKDSVVRQNVLQDLQRCVSLPIVGRILNMQQTKAADLQHRLVDKLQESLNGGRILESPAMIVEKIIDSTSEITVVSDKKLPQNNLTANHSTSPVSDTAAANSSATNNDPSAHQGSGTDSDKKPALDTMTSDGIPADQFGGP